MAGERILVVDDMEINREILAEILKDKYNVVEACNGIEAFEKIIHNSGEGIDLILLDIMMPEMDGYEVLETLGKSGIADKIPVIVITAMGANENETKALEMGAADFITKPFFNASVLKRVELHLKLRNSILKLEKITDENIKRFSDMRDARLHSLADIVERRNLEHPAHVKRMRAFAEELFRIISAAGNMESEVSAINARALSIAAALHDIGKIYIPERIILKPGKLSEAELETLMKHPRLGVRIIEKIAKLDPGIDDDYFEICRQSVLNHHENWDGSGYPAGLRKYDIPLAARITAVADVYDSLISKKVYRPAFSHDEAVAMMNERSGLKFDPIILELFLDEEKKFKELSEK
jgi:putative two-component system response regulator